MFVVEEMNNMWVRNVLRVELRSIASDEKGRARQGGLMSSIGGVM